MRTSNHPPFPAALERRETDTDHARDRARALAMLAGGAVLVLPSMAWTADLLGRLGRDPASAQAALILGLPLAFCASGLLLGWQGLCLLRGVVCWLDRRRSPP